ncbi:MAG: ATP-binding cassette domain-containing protein, partial [Candidatus Marsarchaeota archaeon]|nr:ATP-binding cassette domain-containing protein [Candidatus Marsarchaeota archaeon]
SGKSSLAMAIAGKKDYSLKGDVLLENEKINSLLPEEKAKKGLFIGFQNPVEIPGVSYEAFLNRISKKPVEKNILEIIKNRSLNEGFSGGEKKKLEIAQMLLLNPKIAILDEPDSGLDVDSIKKISSLIIKQSKSTGFLIITHYDRLLKFLKPDFVHVMINGKITTGGMEVAEKIQEKGFKGFQ